MKFWSLNPLQEIQFKNLSESFSEALFEIKEMHAAKTYRNGAKLNYIHPLWFYQKSSTDPSKGEPYEIQEKK